MPLQRKKDWDQQGAQSFHDFILARAGVPFAWGSNDCALYAADAIESITGTDIACDFRGVDGQPAYTTEAEAFALIRSVTGAGADPATAVADAAAYCAAKFGLVEYEHPLFAGRGDLVVMENGGALIAGVVHLNGRQLISMATDGPVRLPITAIRRSWKV